MTQHGLRPWPLAGVVLVSITLLALRATSKRVDVGRRVPPDQQVSIDRIDHSAWNTLLVRYVDDRGRVDYARWQASDEDRRELARYLAELSRGDGRRSAERAAQLAFWINAYNAVTIEGILRLYPTDSIRDHTPRFFGYNIWRDLVLWVGDSAYSLEQIEHDVLRPLGDARVHFGLVCASIGCPRLRAEAFTAARVDGQLDENARQFFGDPKKFDYDAGHRTVQLSPIFKWFAADFGPDQPARLAQIAPYLPDATARKLVADPGVRVTYMPYDWGLNDQAPHRK